MKHILITGATGILGSQLVPLFSKESDTALYLLIRAKSEAELQTRFEKLLAYLEIGVEQAARIVPILGNVSEPQLGISPELYQALTKKCTHVIHAAASIKLNMPEAEAERATLVPTRNILEFIDACRSNGQFSKFEYVSTIGVAGRMQGRIGERFFNEPREFHNNYEKYKAQSEALVHERMQAGLHVTIHRPSMIVGDSRNGKIIHFQGFYFLVQLFSGKLTYGFLPDLPKLTIDTVPVDYVAAGIHWSASDPAACGKILHYTSAEQSLPVTDFIHLVRNTYTKNGIALPALRLINHEWFTGSIRLIKSFSFGRLRSRLNNLLLFLQYMKNEQIFGHEKTVALLTEHRITFPVPVNYLPIVIGCFLGKEKY